MNKEDLAFPYTDFDENHKGLTKREYIATQLLAGVCANSRFLISDNSIYVKVGIDLTDELMKQLSETK